MIFLAYIRVLGKKLLRFEQAPTMSFFKIVDFNTMITLPATKLISGHMSQYIPIPLPTGTG